MSLSASKLELAQRCEGNLTLPHVDEQTQWSEDGNARHAEDEAAITAGDIPDAYRERWPDLTWRAEVSYAYDASDDTARFLGVGIKRAYGAMGPFEIPGTIDAEGRAPGVLVVVDKKSFEAVTPAASNPQVRFLALAAARVEPAAKVHVAINHELTGMDVAELDADLDLDVIASGIRRQLIDAADVRDRARRGLPVAFSTGRWCRWCGGFASCPKQAELKALAKLPLDEPELALKTYVDEESAPDVYELYRRVGILHKRIGQQIHAYVMQRPIPLGNGRMYGMRNKLGNTKIEGKIAHAVLKANYGVEIADAAVTMQATKTAMAAALKGKRGALKTMLSEIDDHGGLKRGTKVVFEEYETGPQLVTESDDEE